MYRQWRDVGVRGFLPSGLPDPSFRGRFASRNAGFTDLMIRAGLRISEQVGLSLYELPRPTAGQLNAKTWLPALIAKAGSARDIYIPAGVLKDIWDYVEIERAEAVEYARREGLYDRVPDRLIIEDPASPVVRIGGRPLPVGKLDHGERARLFIARPHGPEPAALWLNARGLPGTDEGYREIFKNANRRCARHDMPLRAMPQVLRHSFAVIELEHLWRGHLQQLQEMSPVGRLTYQRIYGDPLLWVSRRLGHRSIETTTIYIHTLQELEMKTRIALIPDWWEAVGGAPRQAAGTSHDREPAEDRPWPASPAAGRRTLRTRSARKRRAGQRRHAGELLRGGRAQPRLLIREAAAAGNARRSRRRVRRKSRPSRRAAYRTQRRYDLAGPSGPVAFSHGPAAPAPRPGRADRCSPGTLPPAPPAHL